MMRARARLRSFLRRLACRAQLDAEMRDEMQLHIELETERLMREQGLNAQEARRRACVAFGGLEKYKEAGRDARGFRWLDALGLDARLAVRMLVKYRGLSVIGGFAMAVAIGIGAAAFEIFNEMLTPALPFDPEARVVSVQIPGPDGGVERRVLPDLLELRRQLQTIEQLGAWRTVQRNLIAPAMPPEPIRIAEMSASGLAIARTPPLLGRNLVPDDEREGAPAVAVISSEAWQARFGGGADIVGRTVNLGGVPHTIVGVMPEGFRFPHSHQFWVPLQATVPQAERRHGPALYLFGRLAPGVTLKQAQAELETVGQHLFVSTSLGDVRLSPRVLPYPREHVDLSHPRLVSLVRLAQSLVGVLSFVVAINIAILLYARTVTRLGEISVRTALGASRRRILAQLFVEALALALLGAVVGLALADTALRAVETLARANGGVPFWIQFELSLPTVAYALAIAVLAAVIMGVVPGLKATGHGMVARLHELSGRSGTRLGAFWTTLVVAQVAAAVAVLPVAAFFAWQVIRMELGGPGFAAERFVVATGVLGEQEETLNADAVRARQLALMARLQREPGVTAVTFSSAVPGFSGSRSIELEHRAGGVDADLQPTAMQVSLDFFSTYEAKLLAGRLFTPADAADGGAVIVNETFVKRYLAGASPLGVRFRYRAPSSDPLDVKRAGAERPWHEIAGVVRDFPRFPPDPSVEGEPAIYHAAVPGAVHPFVISVRYAGVIPPAVADRIRGLGAELDPSLQLRRVAQLSQFYGEVRSFWRYLAWGIGLITLSVLMLSAAGIYAMMSFVVAQRTREIGIRTALGAHPRRVLLGVLGRAAGQVAVGVAIGALVSVAVVATSSLGSTRALALVGAVAALMLVVGLLATWGPARRGLRVPPMEALRAE